MSSPRTRALSFVVGILCYLLPFVSVSCGGVGRSFTGLQLVTGTTVEQPQLFGPPTSQHADSDPVVVVAFVCALVGLAARLFGGAERVLSLLAALIAAGALLFTQSKIMQLAQSQGMGVVSVKMEIGFWLVLLSHAIVVISALLSGRPQQLPGTDMAGHSRASGAAN